MDRLEAMSTLLAVVEAGSFSAASRKLGTPLPTISRKIADLEAHLKTRLLVRSTRTLALTDSGNAYVAASRRILDQVREAEAAASGEYDVPRGELILSAPIMFGRLHVIPVINDFLTDYPEIDARVVLTDRNVDLIDDHVDMAARIGPLPDSSMVATRIGSVRRVVCGSPGYFSSHGTPATLDDLSDLSCVTFSGLSSGSSWIFSTPGRGPVRTMAPRCRLSVNTAEAAIDSAIAGVGVTRVLSYQIARDVAEGRLSIVLRDFEPEAVPVHLVHAGQGLLPLKMRRFLDFAVPRLRSTLAAEPDRS